MHCDGLADDKAIADEFADGLTGVGVGDFIDFIGIEPDLALATADYGSGEALLRPKVDPGLRYLSVKFLSLCGEVMTIERRYGAVKESRTEYGTSVGLQEVLLVATHILTLLQMSLSVHS